MFPVRPQKEKINISLKTTKSIFNFIMPEDNNAQWSMSLCSDVQRLRNAISIFSISLKLLRLSGVPLPFLTVGALQDETSGVQVASLSIWLIQVPRAGFGSLGVVTGATGFLPHVSFPVNPSQ